MAKYFRNTTVFFMILPVRIGFNKLTSYSSDHRFALLLQALSFHFDIALCQPLQQWFQQHAQPPALIDRERNAATVLAGLNCMAGNSEKSRASRFPCEETARLEFRHTPDHRFQLRLANANAAAHPESRTIQTIDLRYRCRPLRP